LQALNARGRVLLILLVSAFVGCADFGVTSRDADQLVVVVKAAEPVVLEEERTRQRSVFTVLRLLLDLFRSSEDPYLGLYGAFGYELAFQFEAPQLRLPRNGAQRDLVLYLPDCLLVVDHQREVRRQLAQHMWQLPLICMNFEVPVQCVDGLPEGIGLGPFWNFVRDTRHIQANAPHARLVHGL
jgi:anthranilate/para-aminobenzoate synthase component I